MKFDFIPWGRIGLIVGLSAGLVLVGLWQGAERRADKLSNQLVKARQEIGRLSVAGQQMQAENTRTITRWRTRTVEVDRNARMVENAPLPGNCQTPKEVTEAVE